MIASRTVALPRPPTRPLPTGTCDAHTHVFAEPERFPYRAAPSYPPPVAPYDLHRRMLQRTGATRAVLIQPAPYADDLGALLQALGQAPEVLRGVGVAAAGVSDTALAATAGAGVRGLRFIEARMPDGTRYAGSVGVADLLAMGPRMVAHGLHAELWADLDQCLEALPQAEALGVPLVLDHMAGFDPARGVADPDFQRLLEALRDDRVWVKLTLCRRSPDRPQFRDLRPFHEALVAANPDRLVWGSDWPFVRMDNPPDVGGLIDQFADWLGDEALRRRILVDNPARLYGFEVLS